MKPKPANLGEDLACIMEGGRLTYEQLAAAYLLHGPANLVFAAHVRTLVDDDPPPVSKQIGTAPRLLL